MKRNVLLLVTVSILSIKDSIAQVISAGYYHSLAACMDGQGRGWGNNSAGALGNDVNSGNYSVPDSINTSGIKLIDGSNWYSLVLKNDSTVWAFGDNPLGQLGNGDTNINSNSHPSQVLLLTEIVAIAAGGRHALALKKDGTVWAWGWNIVGQLGNGDTATLFTPVQITALSGIAKIAAGDASSYALKGDGTVWSWGANASGQLGLGDNVERHFPEKITSLSNIIDISSHLGEHCLALKNDGTVWSWGFNQYGQLGNGNNTSQSTPTYVNGLTSIKQIFTGHKTSYAIDNNGQAYGFGFNSYGLLGDSTQTHRNVPVLSKTIVNAKEISGGFFHTIFLKYDGSVWGIGTNNYGQLGTGNFTNNYYAVRTQSLCSVNPFVDVVNYDHYVHGKLYADSTNDCILQSYEKKVPLVVVKGSPGDYYGFANDTGYYSLGLNDTATYTINPVIPQAFSYMISNPCPLNQTVSLVATTAYDTSGFDFGFDYNPCWQLRVDVAANRKRRCFANTTSVRYWNYGLATATNVQVHVKFAEFDIPISASLPFTIDTDSSLVFNIDTLQPWQYGTITIIDSVACIPDISGLTQCTEAWILPINQCHIDSTTGPGWDHSSLKVYGHCVNDTCRFVIRNSGSGSMAQPSQYRIYANNVLVYSNSFQLASGDSLIVLWVSGGATIRLEADQHPDHPGNSHPRETLEGCGTDALGNFSMGEVDRAPMDDEDVDVEIDCMEIRDSYDPNDKANSPLGVATDHLILPYTPVDFTVRFQNTGTDTAYKVVVIDSLSNDLDLATLELGAASHAYSTSLSGQGMAVLKFTFNNINLVDSITDELNSHGFIKYKISPKSGTPLGTRINNSADIYFDYNFPVRTNTAFVTIGNELVLGLNNSLKGQSGSVLVFPNPTSESFTLQCNMPGAELKITDVAGRVVITQKINSQLTQIHFPFSAGIYFLRVRDGEKVFMEKLVIE